MKSYTFLIVAAAFFGAATVSCNSHKSEEKQEISFTVVHHAQNYRLDGSASSYQIDSDLVYLCEARLLMPSDLCGHNPDTLRSAILKVGFDTIGEYHGRILEESMLHAAAEFGFAPVAIDDTIVGNNDGCFIVDGDVRDMTNRTLAYAVTRSTYQPYAAHGMYTTTYLNYDLEQGRLFSLGDIVTSDGMKQLPDILARTARTMRGMIGATQLEALPADSNFYVDLRGNIVFVYQPYEIASYAQGIIEIPLQAYRITDMLTPYGISVLLGTDNE